jgi:hypothetical protein
MLIWLLAASAGKASPEQLPPIRLFENLEGGSSRPVISAGSDGGTAGALAAWGRCARYAGLRPKWAVTNYGFRDA